MSTGESFSSVAVACGALYVALSVLYKPDGGREVAPGVHRGRHLVFVGDVLGFVTVYDVAGAMDELGVKVVPYANMVCFASNYNSMRRVRRDAALEGLEIMTGRARTRVSVWLIGGTGWQVLFWANQETLCCALVCVIFLGELTVFHGYAFCRSCCCC